VLAKPNRNSLTAAGDDGTVAFDFMALTPRERYKLLIGSVVPRPIALVTSVDLAGRVNAAPFSFFNCLSADPAILALGVENHADMSFKDTGRNVRLTGEFTVHIVGDALAEAMNVCAVAFTPDIDELREAGLTAVPGTTVSCPRIAEAPVAFECRRYVTLEVGKSREIILGEVRAAFFRPGLVDERFHVDATSLDAIGRMGGHGYTRTRDLFDLETPRPEDWWRSRSAGVRTPHRR
jgi:flavin reductase (DIM6/NTAB) family NADH-FMN oxidoreductase RutF